MDEYARLIGRIRPFSLESRKAIPILSPAFRKPGRPLFARMQSETCRGDVHDAPRGKPKAFVLEK